MDVVGVEKREKIPSAIFSRFLLVRGSDPGACAPRLLLGGDDLVWERITHGVQLRDGHAAAAAARFGERVKITRRTGGLIFAAVDVVGLRQQMASVVPSCRLGGATHPDQFAECVRIGLDGDRRRGPQDDGPVAVSIEFDFSCAICVSIRSISSRIPCSISPSRIAFSILKVA
jgi:hypothetical protein